MFVSIHRPNSCFVVRSFYLQFHSLSTFSSQDPENFLAIIVNYISLSVKCAKIYNALLRNRIEPKIDNILRKNQNGFQRNRSTTSQILTIHRILEGVRAKNLQATLIFVDVTKAFDSIHRRKMEQILLAYGIAKGKLWQQ